MLVGHRLDYCGSAEGQEAGCCEHSSEHGGFHRMWEISGLAVELLLSAAGLYTTK